MKKQPRYKALDIARFFIGQVDVAKGDSITPLKVQKLVYYSQAWNYTLFGEPLFDEKIEAWAHGPVIESVWREYKSFATRNSPIDISKVTCEVPDFDDQTKKLLADIRRIYAEHSGTYLERLTHSEAPWQEARQGLTAYAISNNEITLDSMKKYYSSLSKKK
jgi:uncharacterized phage-associated protein